MEKRELKFISSWDDGSVHDKRLSGLLKYFGLPGIFFIPTCTDLSDDEIKEIAKDFEIGGHTISHPTDIKRITGESLFFELAGNKDWLKQVTGQEITKFAYPSGKYNSDTIKALQICGFEYARTTLVGSIEEGIDKFRIKTTVHCRDRKEYNGLGWIPYARKKLKEIDGWGGVFHLWGHSWEIDKLNQWIQLEAFLRELTDNYIIKPYYD